MKESRDDGPFEKHAFAIAAGFCGAFIAIWMLDFAVVRADWCEGAKVSCLRDWLSATSGWVAAIVAIGVGAITIGPLQRQVNEAKRQTDFTVGDAAPEFVLVREKRAQKFSLRVTNWNRRSVAVDNVEIHLESLGRIKLAIDGYKLEQREHKYFPVFIVRGWIDRSRAPISRELRFVFAADRRELDLHISLRGRISATIDYRVIGQAHERQVTHASAVELN